MMKTSSIKALSLAALLSLSFCPAGMANAIAPEVELALTAIGNVEKATPVGHELHGRVMRVDFLKFYSHRTLYHADGTYEIVDSKGDSSSGKWWIENDDQLCFKSIIGKEACWVYERMEEGHVYQNYPPYDGTLVHAFLEPVGSMLR